MSNKKQKIVSFNDDTTELTMLHRPERAWLEWEVARFVGVHRGAASRSMSRPFDLILYGHFMDKEIQQILPDHGASIKYFKGTRKVKKILVPKSLPKKKTA